MSWLHITLIFGISLQLANCAPYHHGIRTHKRQIASRPCERMSDAIGEILPLLGVLVPPQILDVVQRSVEEFIVGFDLFDPVDRQRAVCELEGLDTLSEFITALEGLELDYSFFRLDYNSMTVMLRLRRDDIQERLANPDPREDIDSLQLQANFVESVEASGFLNLDPAGEDVAFDILDLATVDRPDHVQTLEHAPLSPLPIQQQCSKLTNDMRKLWNAMVKRGSRWDPNHSQEMREIIKEWTGIDPINQQNVQDIVCNLLEAASSSNGLYAVYNVIKDMQIMEHALKAVYPYAQAGYGHLLTEVTENIHYEDTDNPTSAVGPGGPHSGGPGGPQSGGPQQPPEMVGIFQNLVIIVTSIQEMGLIDMEDDLFLGTAEK